jgi:hypothetical protein
MVHILDVAFIKEDPEGNISTFEFDGLDDVLEFGFADIDGKAGGVLSDEDLELVAETLEPGSSVALIVWEHRWAARVAQAIRDAGGRIMPSSSDAASACRTSDGFDHRAPLPLSTHLRNAA